MDVAEQERNFTRKGRDTAHQWQPCGIEREVAVKGRG
jgi:hypothetical protein